MLLNLEFLSLSRLFFNESRIFARHLYMTEILFTEFFNDLPVGRRLNIKIKRLSVDWKAFFIKFD